MIHPSFWVLVCIFIAGHSFAKAKAELERYNYLVSLRLLTPQELAEAWKLKETSQKWMDASVFATVGAVAALIYACGVLK